MGKITGLKRVVVTGLGLITPLGLDVATTWKAMLDGKSGIDWIANWGDLDAVKEKYNLPDDFPFIAGEIKGFNIKDLIKQRKPGYTREDLKQVKYMDPFIQFADAAALEAVADSGANLESGEIDPNRVGVIIGSGQGGIQTLETEFNRLLKGKKVSPFLIPREIPNLAAGNISISFKAKGINACLVTACASGTHASADAFQRIQTGKEDAILCGGAEASITPLTVSGFHALRALSPRFDSPKTASRPFDKDRNGFVMSEGAGVLILEEREHALVRGANIYAEVVGCGMTGDASHITDPDTDGAVRCMRAALKDAGIKPEDVDLINPHATSTPKGDINEVNAIKTVFGTGREKPLITASKSQLGHSLGAVGAMEAVLCVLSIRDSIVPPVLNLEKIDEQCKGLNYVRGKSKKADINVVLSNSFGFGGTNASLIFRKHSG
ncbi:beta-ketoacyl-ACP synthase II [Thermodesulfobacteriota bacterium]